jgi:threonine/homoserine/homoserine lactone efflux protein
LPEDLFPGDERGQCPSTRLYRSDVPSTNNLLAFSLTAFVIIVIPGPSVMFVVSRALAYGRRAAALTVIGNTFGEYLQVVAVAFGIGLLVERAVALFTVLKLLGAAYLVYLGAKAIYERKRLGSALDPSQRAETARRYFLQGFTVGATNPKTVIFLVAILPEFVSRSAGYVPEQILLLGLVFSAIALVSDNLWGIVAGSARSWFAKSPRRLEMIGGLGGLAIIGIGLRLALTGRKD